MITFRRIAVLLCLSVAVLALSEPGPQAGVSANDAPDLHLTLTGFRNNKGVALVSLFRSKKGFPSRYRYAARTAIAPITHRTVSLVLTNVVPGVCAVAVCHDENNNGDMDTNWLGIPREGYGTSNNPAQERRPPDFKDARFTVADQNLDLAITIRYWK